MQNMTPRCAPDERLELVDPADPALAGTSRSRILRNCLTTLVCISFLLRTGTVNAQFSIAATGTTYTQDFNSLTNGAWADGSTLNGWYARTDATPTISSYGANTGSTTTAGLYAFGVAGVGPLTDRALGYAPSNAFTGSAGTGKGYVGWRLKNNTGVTVAGVTVTWTGEQWRDNNNSAAHSLELSWQTGAVVSDPVGGPWTPAAPSFTSPQHSGGTAVLDGNSATNRTVGISVTFSVTIPAGEEIMLRWEDLNNSGNDHFLTIDDVSVSVSCIDSDGDSVCDELDGCPSDPLKTAAGICGCGVADTDSDSDGTADCNDGCPNDPLKTAAGICGCGVADTDSDSDGTADCIDGCPNDPNKVAAGVCGCGVADVDADGDGVYTCQGDLCDNDPLKTTPGICGCGVADTDTDSDGTADCNDGCPNDPNKVAAGVCGCGVADVDADSDGVYTCQGDLCDNDPLKTTPGVCGCGVPDTDTDSDGTADCVDGCPNDPNKVAAGQCGCGNPDTDTDGDGTADCNDACPEDPYKIVPGICGCDTPDDDTDSDGLADCIDPCPESPTNDDTDADGTADCFDNCPLDPAKVNPGACGCGNPDIDSDGDTYMDCLDGCPSDPNKIGPGTCGCGVPEIDTDGDGLKDCVDQCPLVVGQPGSPCDDGDPSTENDVLNLSCACTGTPAEQPTTLELTTDNDGSATSWEIVPIGGGPAVCSGSGYPSNSTQTIPCALPDGCWSLRVHDAAMDGMCCMNGIGGYVLRAPNGGRIIDAEDAGIFGATAMENLGFCLPMGNDQLTPSRCDREDYMPSDFIQAVPNPAVQAQYGVGSQTDDGYQFWFFKPNGGYSRRVFITHANSSYIFPSGPDRCSYFRLNSLSTFPLPLNTLLNVRVRSVVNGVYSDFGPACRLKIDTETNCPTTQLVATPGPNMSCGLTGVLLNGSTTLHAVPVSGATRYLFEFSKPGYVRNITSSTSSLVITKWSTWPLEYGNTYNVRVKVSFDNGASYCLFGSSCTMSTASGPQGMAQEPETRGMVEPQASSVLNFWPNPNVTGQLTIELSDVGNGAHTGQVEIISMLGTTVQSEGLNFDGDKLNTVLQLDRRVAPGSYLVRVIVDRRNWTERLVIQ